MQEEIMQIDSAVLYMIVKKLKEKLDVKDFGYMIVEVLGPDQQVDQALAFMKEAGVYVEVLK